jgi:hypothetical protein
MWHCASSLGEPSAELSLPIRRNRQSRLPHNGRSRGGASAPVEERGTRGIG